jgi:hypothetical protein
MSIIFLLDESSSMYPYKNEYIKTINSVISTQKISNPNVKFTLIKFSDYVKLVYYDVLMSNVEEFKPEHYKPEGSTSLYDGIGYCIRYKENERNVILVIITDGEENTSSLFNKENIINLINKYSNNGWEFIYIATNQNAKEVGESLSIHTCITYNQTEKSISNIAEVCNISIGHAIYKLTGIENKYIHKEIPNDISDFMMNLRI